MFWSRALLLSALTCMASTAAGQAAVAAVEAKTAPSLGAPALASQRAQTDVASPGNEGCLLQEFCVGPLLTLGAIDPLGVGAHMRYGRYVGFGVDYQFLPMRIDLGAISSTWSLVTIEGRAYPFGNAFFVALGFGYESFSARVRQMTPSGPVSMTGSVAMPALKLGIGFMGHDGFVLGADIGFNVLLGKASVDLGKATGPGATYPTAAVALEQQVNDYANEAVAELPVIPQINLIRMGYLF